MEAFAKVCDLAIQEGGERTKACERQITQHLGLERLHLGAKVLFLEPNGVRLVPRRVPG